MADEVIHHPGPLPPVPPGAIASSIKKATFDALAQLPAGSGGAVVRLSHDQGVELAFAHKGANGNWQVDAYVGKKWEKGSPLTWRGDASVLW